MGWEKFLKSMMIIFLNMVGATYSGVIFEDLFEGEWGVVLGGVVYLMAVVIVYARKIIHQQNQILEALKNKESL